LEILLIFGGLVGLILLGALAVVVIPRWVDRKQLITAVVVFVVTAALIGTWNMGASWVKDALSQDDDAGPSLDLSGFLPKDYRVRDRLEENLDGTGHNEIMVTTVGPLNEVQIAPTNIVIFAWDSGAGPKVSRRLP
jgi:hypothetical protein